MSRMQLALNVDDVDAAVAFYSKLFDTQPAKRRDGYANFAIAEPPLKLVLLQNPGRGGTLNHLGVEVETSQEVAAATGRLAAAGLVTSVEDNTTCCYATQDKVWVDGPGGEPWEIYTVLADSATFSGESANGTTCCGAAVTSPAGNTHFPRLSLRMMLSPRWLVGGGVRRGHCSRVGHVPRPCWCGS
jgi:catechol 2,3-dioxygenase-like lactoylglutathione lyase family enzyme